LAVIAPFSVISMLLSRPWYLAGLLGSWLPLLVGIQAIVSDTALAQSLIQPDDTLGIEQTQIIENFGGLPIEVITGGAQRGQNLFHSFQDFNISENRGAYFFNPNASIQNILARITGGSASEILGTLGTFGEGSPNLFLMNPNGIVFGPNSSLAVTGSFLATTANAIELGDSTIFSASEPGGSSLLTINPSALFFNHLDNTPIISNQSVARQTVIGSPVNGLQAGEGRSLILVGGDIDLNRGGLTTVDGQIELAGVRQNGRVGMEFDAEQINLIVPEDIPLADIRIDQGGFIRHSGSLGDNNNFTGGIRMYGDEIILSNASNISTIAGLQEGGSISGIARALTLQSGSQINTSSGGQGNAGDIQINVSETTALSGASIIGSIAGGLPGTPAGAGNIIIDTSNLDIQSGSGIASFTFLGEGDAGDIRVNAVEANLDGGAIATISLGTGQGGGIVIETQDLSVRNSSGIASTSLNPINFNINNLAAFPVDPNAVALFQFLLSFIPPEEAAKLGQSNSGNIIINAANSVRLSNVGRITSETRGGGSAGAIQIAAGELLVEGGSQIGASTFGTGNANDVILNIAGTAVFDGVNPITGSANPTTASSSVEIGGRGNAGDVRIASTNLEVRNGAQLSAFTAGEGFAGNVILNITETARFDGVNLTDGSPTAAASAVAQSGIGDGGNLQLSARNLEVTDGAFLAASTFGIGSAGNVILNISETARFDGVNPVTGLSVSGARSAIEQSGVGTGGNVELYANNLEVTNGAQLTASTFGTGDAGNVILTIRETARFDGVNPSTGVIPSGARSSIEDGGEGTGGNVELSATNLEVTNGAQLTASSFGRGDAGNVILTITDTARFDGVNLVTGVNPSGAFSTINPGGEGTSGNVELSATNLKVTNGAQLIASTFGQGDAGNVVLTITDTARFDGVNPVNGDGVSAAFSRIEPSGEGRGGNVQLTARTLEVLNGARLSASTLGRGEAGNVVLAITDLARVAGANPTNGRPSAVSSAIDVSGEGRGGNVQITTDNLEVLNGALLFSASLGIGDAGNITLIVPTQLLVDNATIGANSNTASGGQINIQAGHVILRNDGDIQTFVNSGAGGGGNITIAANFLIALDDSDILAFSADGRGGNIDLSRTTFFGQNANIASGQLSREELLALDGNDRVDINATGGVASGQITVGDSSFIENSLTALADTITDTAALTAGSCIARSNESLGSFAITGSGGLPQRPGDSGISAYPTGTVRTGAVPNTTLQEPDGVYQLPDGRLVLSRACE